MRGREHYVGPWQWGGVHMTSERYLAIIRPLVRDMLRMARQPVPGGPEQITLTFRTMFGVEGVTQREYAEAVQWLWDAVERAQVIVRLDIMPFSEHSEGSEP